jgi:hypothetical protein
MDDDNPDSAHPDLDDPLFWVKLDPAVHEALRAMARQRVNQDSAPLTMLERGLVLQNLLDDILGFGPLGPLLRDPSVDNILVIGPDMVFVTREGRGSATDVIFANKEELEERIAVIVYRFMQTSSDELLARRLNIYTAANGWLVPELLSEALQEETAAFKGMPLVIVAMPRKH